MTNLTEPGPVDNVRKAVDNFRVEKKLSSFKSCLGFLFIYFLSRSVRKAT